MLVPSAGTKRRQKTSHLNLVPHQMKAATLTVQPFSPLMIHTQRAFPSSSALLFPQTLPTYLPTYPSTFSLTYLPTNLHARLHARLLAYVLTCYPLTPPNPNR